MNVPVERTFEERRLEKLQQDIAKGELARAERDRLVARVWLNGRMQSEIAVMLTKASAKVGGPPVSRNSIQKVIARFANANGDRHE